MINGFVWTSLVPQNSVVYHNFPFFCGGHSRRPHMRHFYAGGWRAADQPHVDVDARWNSPSGDATAVTASIRADLSGKKNRQKARPFDSCLADKPRRCNEIQPLSWCSRWLIIFNLDISWSNQAKFSFATWRMLLCVHSCGEHALIWLNYRN